MRRTFIRFLVLAAVVLCPAVSAGEDAATFQPLLSLYTDDKEKPINHPEGVACGDNLLVVADTGNGRLLKFPVAESSIGVGAEIRVPELTRPIRVQVTSKGDILVLDGQKRRIERLGAGGEFKGYLEPKGLPSGLEIVPRSFKVDGSDSVYILDIFSSRVLVLDSDGAFRREIVLPKDAGFFSDLAVDSAGAIAVIDSVSSMVYVAAPDAKVFSPLTKRLKDFLDFPTSLTVDKRGILYILDRNGGRVVLLGRDGTVQGQRLAFGLDPGMLYYPTQICITEKGLVFISDGGGNRVQVFD